MTSKRVLCVGRIYMDLVFRSPDLPAWGRETFASGFDAMAGGGAFITAAYLTAEGHALRLAGSAGAPEPFGHILRRDLAECRIDGSLLAPGEAAQVTVAVAGREDRAFLTHRDPAPLALPEATDFDHLHVGELSSLVECPGLLDLARRAGATISADCGDEAAYPPGCADLIAGLDLFMPSAAELARLEAAGLDLGAHAHLVVKRGAEGASARMGGEWHHAPAQKAEIRDTTGAGDAFNAGYLSAWLAGAPPAACLARGAALGAAAVASIGGWTGRAALTA